MSRASRKALTPDQLDNLGLALIELAKEMWVMKDRQMVTEALLSEKGLLADLDAYQPGPELAGLISSERKRFLGAFSSALFHQGDA
jgi:hypothetical protein